jgi:deazaflavin-dependent oxidoreductase (nitroreductase family)
MRGPQHWSDKVNEWNRKVVDEFRATGGKVGGPAAGQPLLLLHTKGARTGLARVTPMVCLENGTRLFVFASKDGADTHPDWFHNVSQDPAVFIEVGTRAFAAVARVLDEPDRSTILAHAAERFPRLAENVTMTSRIIPVIELVPDAERPDHDAHGTTARRRA